MSDAIPAILEDDRRIVAVYGNGNDETSLREGVSGVTAIKPYTDCGIIWLAVYRNSQLTIRIPANMVSVYYA